MFIYVSMALKRKEKQNDSYRLDIFRFQLSSKNGSGKSFQNHYSVTPLYSNFAKLPPFLNAKK